MVNYMCMYCYQKCSVFGQRDWRHILVLAYHVYPHLVELLEGMKVKLYCGSSSPLNWSFTRLNWSSNWDGGVWLNIPLLTLGRTYTFMNDSGLYNCFGKYDYVLFFHFSSVKVYTEVLRGQVLPNWMVTSEGDSVILSCGSIKPVEWFSAHFHSQNITLESKNNHNP